MEQANSGKAHHHIIFVTAFDYKIVSYGAAWLGDIGNAGFSRTFNVVRKWEESVRTASYAGHLV